jgi:hypothetical protein
MSTTQVPGCCTLFDPVSGAPVMRSIPCRIVPLRRKLAPAAADLVLEA